jgi:hypothetical protein
MQAPSRVACVAFTLLYKCQLLQAQLIRVTSTLARPTSPTAHKRSEMSFPSAITSTIRNPRLRLLNALLNGSKPINTFMGLPSFRTAQMVAQTGVDVCYSEEEGALRLSFNRMLTEYCFRVSSSTASTATSATTQCTARPPPLHPCESRHSFESG